MTKLSIVSIMGKAEREAARALSYDYVIPDEREAIYVREVEEAKDDALNTADILAEDVRLLLPNAPWSTVQITKAGYEKILGHLLAYDAEGGK